MISVLRGPHVSAPRGGAPTPPARNLPLQGRPAPPPAQGAQRYLAPGWHSRAGARRRLMALGAAASGAVPGTTGGEGEQRWRGRIEELEAHREEFGHTAAVLGSPLGKWVYLQRRLYKEGKLTEAQIADLEGVGFEWEHPYDKVMASPEGWKLMVAELAAFKDEHGHAEVKKKEPTNPALGYWVNDQRIAYREGRLDASQVAELEALGMVWLPKKQCGSRFMVGFRQLMAYRDEHGTLEVPDDGSDEEREIVDWCRAQRAAYDKGLLSDKRVAYLDGVGFFAVW